MTRASPAPHRRSRARRRASRLPRFAALLLFSLAALLSGVAAAHATLIIGQLTFEPDPPVPGEQVRVRISLVDPLLVPTEKAIVRVELREISAEHPDVPASVTGTEAREFLELPHVYRSDHLEEVDRGIYSGQFTVPTAGDYTLSVRDTTFWNEEAIANLGIDLGGSAFGVMDFVLPPTPIAPKSLGTWLLWIIGVPLVAGGLVTVLVLRRGAPDEEEAESGAEGEGSGVAKGVEPGAVDGSAGE